MIRHRITRLVLVGIVAIVSTACGDSRDGIDGDTAADQSATGDSAADETGDDPTESQDTSPSSRGNDDRDSEAAVADGKRPMVVVSNSARRVSVYFADGEEPMIYDSQVELLHAEVGPDRTLWVTTGLGFPAADTTLRNVDPTTGKVLSEITGAGFASMSPDGMRMAYSQISATVEQPGAVVITSMAGTEDELVMPTTVPNDPEMHFFPLGQINWSPDGSRLLVNEYGEDDVVWLVDLQDHSYIRDGIALGMAGADWISDDRLLATAYCCYREVTTPRHLIEVDLSTPEPTFIDRDERSGGLTATVPAGGLDTAVHIVGTVEDGGTLVRLTTGDVIAEDVVSVQW